jgi:hypothetical protein
MDKRTCLGCRFGLAKIEILPEENDLSEFVAQRQNFASDISSLNTEKPIHNLAYLRSGEDSLKVLISIIH